MMVFVFLEYFQFPSQNNLELILLSFLTKKPHNLDCCMLSHFYHECLYVTKFSSILNITQFCVAKFVPLLVTY